MVNPGQVDTLIVGQGLAGSLLAWQLLMHGQRVLVLDDGHASCASMAAAGLLTPITGKRLVKTPGFDTLLAEARELYHTLSERLGQPFYFAKDTLRLIQDEQEADALNRRREQPGYQPYLGEALAAGQYDLKAPFGGFIMHHSGYVAMQALLTALRSCLQENDCYRKAHCRYPDFKVTPEDICWQDIRARRLIFCEGYQSQANPWFDWLPFQPAKGEILTVQLHNPLPDLIISAGKWLVPIGKQHYRLGATYEWTMQDEAPSEAARQTLLQGLHGMLEADPQAEVLEQRAGVRPGTQDKQPFIGMHPLQSNIGIFNGFGSKGGLLIPHYAALFAEVLSGPGILPEDVDIRRHYNA